MQRKLSQKEIPQLVEAQLLATKHHYTEWVQLMRKSYPYGLVVRMAQYLGFTLPGRGFYRSMRKEGQNLKQRMEREGQVKPKPCVITITTSVLERFDCDVLQ